MSRAFQAPLWEPLTGTNLLILTIALPLATFMQVVDTTIANVAVQTISGNLGASYSQGTWIITSYSVANAIVLPLTGPLAQRFGEKRLFLWSTGLFALASTACGLSQDMTALVIFRIIQGAVGGPMIPLAQSLLMNNYPREKQVMALALFSMTVSVAPVFGPIMGGYISDNFHWSWIFFINIPFGLAVLLLSSRVLAGRETKIKRPRWSGISFGLLALGVGAFQMMLDRGKDLDWFNSPSIQILAVIAVTGLTLLLVWEYSNPKALIDLSLFKYRNFCVGITLISAGMMLYMGTVVLIPLLLQTRYAYTATWAGLATAPIGILPVIMMPLLGRYSKHIDMRFVITAGFGVLAVTMHMRTGFEPGMDMRYVLLPQFIQGIGLACFFAPITSITFIGMDPGKIAGASGLYNCSRTLFSAIGASISTTFWERREALHQTRLSGLIDAYNPLATESLRRLTDLGMTQDQAAGYLERQIVNQSFIISANEIFQACSYCFLFLIILVWLSKPAKTF
ncbi:MAG: DHA2 family efflux MFS transporter permease subunit [Deltaproteobacteria bacterium]|jgi:DHA2 family multidrug resistance protein|nr:DHA2 family efflux MFS transporter permease subunit [Deltaproteobacteria bacterium]